MNKVEGTLKDKESALTSKASALDSRETELKKAEKTMHQKASAPDTGETDHEKTKSKGGKAQQKSNTGESQATKEEAIQALEDSFGTKVVVATEAEKDDLKEVKGVGPFIEEKLNKLGIYTFEQISQFDDQLVEQVTIAIAFFPGRIQRDDWVGQAKKLHQAKLEKA